MLHKFEPRDIDQAVEYFESNGYVIFQNVLSAALAEAFWSAVEENVVHNPNLQFSFHGQLFKQRDLPENLRIALPRIIDIQGHVPLAAHLMFCDPISGFLEALYGTAPTCLQTLTYKFSSEQGAHSDCYLVSPPCAGEYNRRTLAAVWMPFEPANRHNGALVVYPGSHKLAKKRLDVDFHDNYADYARYLHRLCEDCGCPPESYEAAVGEILFWHGDFVHAGGPIAPQSTRPTRRSLVCHYGVVPANRPSLSEDWVRLKTARGSYYIPSASLIAATSGRTTDAQPVTSD